MSLPVRRVAAIRDGTVIDHVPAGISMMVLKMLEIDGRRSNPVSLLMNVPSDKLGMKDIIKIEDRELSQHDLDRLALIAGEASVSIIRNFEVSGKRTIRMPDEFVNVASCAFTNCITFSGKEPLTHRLRVISRDPTEIRCHYCGRIQPSEGITERLG